MSNNSQNMTPGSGYKLLKFYLRFVHSKFFYKKVYWLNTENIPDNGSLMIVSNHQNGLSDVLGIIMSVPNRTRRKIRVVARADVFKPVFSKALKWLGLMPAFRMAFEGAEALSNNAATFDNMSQELINEGTVVIYPEAGHQDKHWLGTFSLAYLRIIFEAAEKTNFQKEFFILPCCNHYSYYFYAREKILVKYGTPISLAPYYELYKTKPRTAQRQVNLLVREQIAELMLNITDLENYSAIDFLRQTYGIKYAQRRYYDPNELPEKLESDKEFFNELEKQKELNPDKIESIYKDALLLKNKIETLKISDKCFDKNPGSFTLIIKGIPFLILLPLFIFSCIPNILIYYIPRKITSKIEDRMAHSGFDFGITALASAPILYILTFIITWVMTQSFLIAFIYLICLPFLGLFMYFYMKKWKQYKCQIRFYNLLKIGKLRELIDIRKNIYSSLDKILK